MFIIKYYEKNYDSKSTLQYDIQYIKVKTSETAAQNVLDSLKKQKNKLRLKKCVSKKKSTSSVGNVGNFNYACKNNRKRKRCKKQLGTHSTRENNSESWIEKFMKFSK